MKNEKQNNVFYLAAISIMIDHPNQHNKAGVIVENMQGEERREIFFFIL